MLVNLSDVLTSEGRTETMEVPLEMTDFNGRMGDFRILQKSPVRFLFTNVGTGKARVEGDVKLTFQTACDRCLADVPTELALKLNRLVAAPDAKQEDSEDPDDCMEGYQLDVEALVYDEISLNWPMKILCRPDCKGVCPVCGKNLNEGDCGCDTFVPDPRMAAIQDIFNANKEV